VLAGVGLSVRGDVTVTHDVIRADVWICSHQYTSQVEQVLVLYFFEGLIVGTFQFDPYREVVDVAATAQFGFSCVPGTSMGWHELY
jgi:hypothetical protein